MRHASENVGIKQNEIVSDIKPLKEKMNNNLYLSKGNEKLSENILVWSLPAIQTCPNCRDCKDDCYARKAEIQYPEVLPCRTRNWEQAEKPEFVRDMVHKIRKMAKSARKHKVKYVRIHESGDFYNRTYFMKWVEIARIIEKTNPEITFYGYTKVPGIMANVDMPDNMNIVESVMPDGRVNFGEKQEVIDMAKKYKATICPYGKSKKAFTCGIECNACTTKRRVVFIQH